VDQLLPGANAALATCSTTWLNKKLFVNTIRKMDTSFSTVTADGMVALDIPEMVYLSSNGNVTTARRLWENYDEDEVDDDLLRRVLEEVPDDFIEQEEEDYDEQKKRGPHQGMVEEEEDSMVSSQGGMIDGKEERDLGIIFAAKTTTAAPTPPPIPTCERTSFPTPIAVSTTSPYLCQIPTTTATPAPNPSISSPWGLRAISRPDSPRSNPSFTTEGNGVWVWVLDTGIVPEHIEFANRDVRCYSVMAAPDNSCMDENGHGTHVTATAAGGGG